MPSVTVTIAGKAYRIACAEGEEEHLEGLAALFDGKIGEMRQAFGEIGDMRLHVMAAITLADELHETREQVEALEAELAEHRRSASQGDAWTQAIEARLVEGVQRAAERIEQLARSLNAPGPG
jgi:cell division protein ZapA